MYDPGSNQQGSVPGMVTTVITSYNKGPYLSEAIDSALRQDYTPQEIIVIDDGSTDDTPQVAETFGERIRYFFQSNQGPASAKNRGILLGNGEYVAFLDGDDRWRPGKLRRQVEVFDKNPSVGVVYGASATMSSIAAEPPKPRSLVSGFHRGRVLDDLIVKNFIPFSSSVVRRRCIEDTGLLDENLRVADDYELWLRMARVCEFDFVDEIVVDYRVGVDQIGTRVSSREYYDYAIRIQRDFANRFFDGRYPRPGVFRRGIATKYAELGDCLLGAGNRMKALIAHGRAARLDPLNLSRYVSVVRDVMPHRLASRLKGGLSKLSASGSEDCGDALAREQ